MIAPFLMVAVIIRTIDALKSFDIIYAITQGGPGTASETINLYLYSVAFAYYDVGYGSAIAVVFFALVVALSLLMLHLRQRTKWIGLRSGRMNVRSGDALRPSGCGSPRWCWFAGGAVLPLDASLSLKFEVDNAAYPPILIPERFAWKNYTGVFESNRFGLFFVNSLIVTGAATASPS